MNCDPACPVLSAGASLAENRFDLPLGYLRRVAAVDPEVDETKRNLLKLAAVAGVLGVGVGGAVGGAIQYVQPGMVGLSSYPRVQLIDLDGKPLTVTNVEAEYNVGTTDLLIFYYPLRNEPNFLLNLYPVNGSPPSSTNPGAANVPGGVGTYGSIVAYSAICQHLGCPAPALAWYPPAAPVVGQPLANLYCPQTPGGRVFYLHCSCHGSTYDAANSAANLTGPAVLPLPQVVLETDPSGNIFAVGENGPPVNGHLNTLQGDYGIGTSSQLTKETPVILCNIA